MQYRPLGASGIQASVVGFGGWAIGGWMWGGSEESEAIEAVQASLDAGVNLIDTAPAYGLGLSETTIGKAVAGRRDKVILASKCGLVWHTSKGTPFLNAKGKAIHRYLGPESIRYELEQSLKRLNTDYLDLLQTHWQDSTTPIEETMQELLDLKQEGKIRAIGVSNATPEQLEAYRRLGPVDTAQEKYSMLDLELEAQYLPDTVRNNIAVLAYSPLANGLLTGKVGPERRFPPDDFRHDNPRFSQESRERVRAMLEAITPVADKHHLTLAQLVVAWTVAQPGVTHALVGARNGRQARENTAGGSVELSTEDLNTLNRHVRKAAAVAHS